ncbi:MAG: PAS domain S-box protein [Proteobacteria bacterium]|nr:PAS domain S-box protein [Desulfobacula sp.]MBU3951159.1 PAS domain S-box protein [Pseudomonadota bacterium]MBU4129507.1 PAS domain S-box protein [Pseudomonadota bacterium]
MRWSLDSYLKNYDSKEKELQLKARFIILITIAIVLATFITIVHSVLLQASGMIVGIQAVAVLIMIGALGGLVRGNYTLALHSILIAAFASLWTVLFFDPVSPILAKVDSIVLVLGLCTVMSISFFKNRKPIVVYFLINAILFFAFTYHLKSTGVLATDALLEYFFDNFVALIFVFVVSISAFTINQKALSSLKDELVERKNVEKALAESENKLSGHLKRTPVGAIFWDLNFKVIEWNPSAERIFGYTRKEAVGKHAADLILPEGLKDAVERVFQELFSGRGGERSVNENLTKNGKIILCDWYNAVLKNNNGETIGATSLVNDITEKTKIQELMIQSEKMLSIGGLAAGMAHEINNPLSGMIQNAQLAYRRLAEDIPANKKVAEELGVSLESIQKYAENRGILKQLANISDGGQHAAKVIENMLSYSRKSDRVRKETPLEELINNTIELCGTDYDLKRKYNFNQLEIIREYSPDLPPIFCEKSKIQQVLFNIFKNASDSMNLKTYENEAPRLTIRLESRDKNIHIQVEDNGMGMSPETCKHIFEPFFTTKKDKGTGLGLSISYYIIVDDHGGQMKVESDLGKGTRFIIELPLRS